MLEAIGAGQQPRIGNRDWADIFSDSPELVNIMDQISQMKSERLSEVGSIPIVDSKEREYATPLLVFYPLPHFAWKLSR